LFDVYVFKGNQSNNTVDVDFNTRAGLDAPDATSFDGKCGSLPDAARCELLPARDAHDE
jgi:hypothetical protein